MRKGLLLLVAGLVLLPNSASAESAFARGGVKVREDGNDTIDVLDIWEVGTYHEGDHPTVFIVKGYEAFQTHDLDATSDSFFIFNLDTRARGRADRYLYLYYWPPDDQYYCEVLNRNNESIGYKVANLNRPGIISCQVRNAWLDIEKRVRFSVEAWSRGFFVDRAPDVGRYNGL